jgi:hypothetical protein
MLTNITVFRSSYFLSGDALWYPALAEYPFGPGLEYPPYPYPGWAGDLLAWRESLPPPY